MTWKLQSMLPVSSLHKAILQKESTNTIVNATNIHLVGGGGVDGAIHRAGRLVIIQECRAIGRCTTGNAVINCGVNLTARYVIHTVGPRYQGGSKGEAALLISAYLESLKLASARKLKSIAFPTISTGACGSLVHEAAAIALTTTIEYQKNHRDIELVRFVLFDRNTYNKFTEELKNLI